MNDLSDGYLTYTLPGHGFSLHKIDAMKRKETRKNAEMKPDLINHLGLLASTATKSKGQLENIDYPAESLGKTREFLEMPDLQCILFSIILQLSYNDNEVTVNDISDYLECSRLAVLHYINDLKMIEEKKLIRRCTSDPRHKRKNSSSLNKYSYQVPTEVMDALMSENNLFLMPEKKIDMISFLEIVNDSITEREESRITYCELIEKIHILIQANHDIPFIRNLEKFHLSDDNKILLIYLSRETLNGDNSLDLVHSCDKIYADPGQRFMIRREIIRGSSELITKGLISIENGMFRSDRNILLTDKALKALFNDDLDVILNGNRQSGALLLPLNIRTSELFFNNHELSRLNELKNFLNPDNFITIKQNLKNKNLPAGIAILFHGTPGTGKTAFAMQLARETGRSIMIVDISDTKSMWFGESEKKIKKVFTEYRDILKYEKTEPILLFNECDAVFSTRKKIGSSPVDQTENNIQNVILQEIETLQGILIATTNLTDNLDQAFERRFLYKILFSKPDLETRIKIWMNKIPYLLSEEAYYLSSKFLFSGGNIENVYRKLTMKEIIYSKKPAFEEIIRICSEELLSNDSKPLIGFRN